MEKISFDISSAHPYHTELGTVYIREDTNRNVNLTESELIDAKFLYKDHTHLSFNERKMLGLIQTLSDSISDKNFPNLITFVNIDNKSLFSDIYNSKIKHISPGTIPQMGKKTYSPTFGLEKIVDSQFIHYDRRMRNAKKTRVLNPRFINRVLNLDD